MANGNHSYHYGSGLGLFGWLIILGCFSIGPCTDCMSDCGPTVDGPKIIKQMVEKEELPKIIYEEE